jgi:hypothetical protein
VAGERFPSLALIGWLIGLEQPGEVPRAGSFGGDPVLAEQLASLLTPLVRLGVDRAPSSIARRPIASRSNVEAARPRRVGEAASICWQ